MACSITPDRTKKIPARVECVLRRQKADEEFADDCRQ